MNMYKLQVDILYRCLPRCYLRLICTVLLYSGEGICNSVSWPMHHGTTKCLVKNKFFTNQNKVRYSAVCISTPLENNGRLNNIITRQSRNNINSLIVQHMFLLMRGDEEVLWCRNSGLNSWWETVLSVGTPLELELSMSLLVLPNRSQGTNNSDPLFVC